MNRFVKSINRVSLIQQIIIGLIIGILTALYVPDVANEPNYDQVMEVVKGLL